MDLHDGSGLTAALDRHQARREAGVPTVSVLTGPVELAARAGRLWAQGRGRPVVEIVAPRQDLVADAWAAALAASGNLRRLVISRLARRLGDEVDQLEGRIGRMSPSELGLFLETASSDPDGDGTEAACRWILQNLAAGKGLAAPGLASRMGVALPGRSGLEPALRALVALKSLIPAGLDPVILAAQGPVEGGAVAWIEAYARSLAGLVLAVPRLTVILAVNPSAFEDYLRATPDTREKSLMRSGIVAIPGLLDAEGERRPADEDASAGPAGRPPDVAPAGPIPTDPDDRARSAAERFLFEQLESLPATVGLFELNSTLDIPFGPGRAMEVDLASHALKLAIEIDGHFHFQGDHTAYRRDRRKDFLLQAQGYLVVRVLADDVVSRLEDVLDVIVKAVALRRLAGQASNLDPSP